MPSKETGNRYFQMLQAKRGNLDKFRLYTLHPRAERTRYVQAGSEEELQEKANELVAEMGECGSEILTPKGWDVDSIFSDQTPKEKIDLRELPDPSGEQDPE